MNSTINKTLYTCSTESLVLRYKKNSKKAVKLGSFLQCSVHTFLGHDNYVWKINLRICKTISWRTFKTKHGQCDSVIFATTPSPPAPPKKKIAFEDSKLLLELCLVDSRILYFWYVRKSIHKFIIKLDALQCLFLRGLD